MGKEECQQLWRIRKLHECRLFTQKSGLDRLTGQRKSVNFRHGSRNWEFPCLSDHRQGKSGQDR